MLVLFNLCFYKQYKNLNPVSREIVKTAKESIKQPEEQLGHL